jgi:hypothetical protein
MSVGSAFDAYVKSYIVDNLYGKGAKPEFERDSLFEEQVEEHNWDWARGAGNYAFNAYKQSGMLADLMLELEQATEDPRFEFTVEGNVVHEDMIDGIPLLGKPDIWFKSKGGANIIYDWKVNGFCGKSATSPKKGYMMCRDGWDHELLKPSRNEGAPHKDFIGKVVGGVTINTAYPFEKVDTTWANQTCIYQWVMGATVGDENIVGIDQIVAKPMGGEYPMLRVAAHRGIVSKEYQYELYGEIRHVWDTIHDVECEGGYPHVFTDMTRAENDLKCEMLDDFHKAFSTETEKDALFTDMTRSEKF